MENWLRRGKLAQALGISSPTVKYYTALGFFPVQKRTAHGQYLYNLDEIQRRFYFIKGLKEKRFTMQEIKERLLTELAVSHERLGENA